MGAIYPLQVKIKKRQNYQWYRYLYSFPLADQTTNLSKFTYGLADHLNSYIKALLCLECSDGWGLRSFTLQTMHSKDDFSIYTGISQRWDLIFFWNG